MFKAVFAALIATLGLAGGASAEKYPSHPITVVVPFSAGGPSDAMMRILGERMKTSLGEAVLIENVTGGVARSASGGWCIPRRRLHHRLRPSRYACR